MVQPVINTIIFAGAILFMLSVPSGAGNAAGVPVAGITVSGVKEFKAGDIKKVMGTKFPSLLPFVRRPLLDEAVLKNDMNNISLYPVSANSLWPRCGIYSLS